MSVGPEPSTWWRRALRVGFLSFVLAVLVSYLSGAALGRAPAAVAFLIVMLLITVGMVFDVLGTSVTAADLSPLNAMAAKRIHGSRQAIWLVKNAAKVANFANDVVGDVTGAVAGAAGTTVAIQLNQIFRAEGGAAQLTELAVIGLIAGLTVGGKAAGKSVAINRATDVVFMAGRMIYATERLFGRSLTGGRGSNSSRRRST